jgi:hypothetical protein
MGLSGCLPLRLPSLFSLFTKKRKHSVVSSTPPEIESRPPSLVVDEKAQKDIVNIMMK